MGDRGRAGTLGPKPRLFCESPDLLWGEPVAAILLYVYVENLFEARLWSISAFFSASRDDAWA